MKIVQHCTESSRLENELDNNQLNFDVKAVAHRSKRLHFPFSILARPSDSQQQGRQASSDKYALIEDAAIYASKAAKKSIPNVDVRATPSAFSPTPAELATQIVTQICSQSTYCDDGVIGIKGSVLQAAVAVNRKEKEIVLVFNREQKSTGIKHILNGSSRSQPDYLYASNIAKALVTLRDRDYSEFRITITGDQKESKLINYALENCK
ncbi:hypothetical protein [Grimontia hollisae]|uniref:hypothetical protein n=1 Tax=Grimontia hollisae TaxID=673 RepID=UPI000DF941A3|nr:hypothetical protein [Grimontia hollisae]STQ76315.1 Uncharacterised protein [Grimontia hollisae]